MQKPKKRFTFRFYSHLALFYLAGLLITACGGSAQLPIPPLATTSPSPLAIVSEATADKLPTWVVAEREASIQGNVPLLATLWAVDGRIVDGRGSAEESDDYVWAGRAAILDRYQVAVFPAPPPPLTLAELADATLTVEGESATLINGGDRWRFALQDGRWWLQEFRL